MNFLSRIFRVGQKTRSNLAEELDYAKWTKEQLIERVLELENKKKRHIEEESEQSDQQSKKHKAASPDISKKKIKQQRPFDFSRFNTRFIALRFAYLGWNYNGLAIQKEPTPLPTVEGTILEAMNKAKLVPSMVPQEYNFSRCGRTDKGVSAMNQVISLRVRSNLTDDEQIDPTNDHKEIPYINILNQLLPDDIRVSAVCLRPPKNFDARFSCKHRHYKYLFNKSGLDIDVMREAAKLYEGEHDFRNFCKLDGSKQITNYKRTIMKAQILHVDGDIYCFDLIGSAFLWHQVRCMMAILFLIGQKLESPSLIEDLVHIGKTKQKPIYDMASDIPLILYDCQFPDMEWSHLGENDFKSVNPCRRSNAMVLGYQLKATISRIFEETAIGNIGEMSGRTIINTGDGKGKVVVKYQKMQDRNVMDSVESVNQKYRNRKARRK
ncbi:LAFE_0B07096g1_1 [Lachancea fermentati]|uniref:LAFE_0B07096g1_1 n=1 Tax=Lachancea fermentati TaxID=4955 RepID=A0A1G4M860_LACFM|nr:LAFE_0B07096g1_1 [Lachancea fermentati]